MTRLGYFWTLVRRSFHGTLRTLEIGEAFAALMVHVAGYFFHEWKEPLEVVFVALLGLLVLTFFIGLFLAAYASNKEMEEVVRSQQTELDTQRKKAINEIAELESRQNSNPARNAMRLQVTTFLEQFKSFKIAIVNGDKKAAVGAYQLEHSVVAYLNTHLPQYTDFRTHFQMSLSMPHQSHVNMDEAIARCQKRIEQLNELLRDIIG